jgi:hypothetical protein
MFRSLAGLWKFVMHAVIGCPQWIRSLLQLRHFTIWFSFTATRTLNPFHANYCGRFHFARPPLRNHKMFRRLHLFIDANLARAAGLPVWKWKNAHCA